MLRTASLHAYDVMSSVVVHVHVREYEDAPPHQSSIVFECTTTVPGTGESDQRLWLQDALVAMLEAI